MTRMRLLAQGVELEVESDDLKRDIDIALEALAYLNQNTSNQEPPPVREKVVDKESRPGGTDGNSRLKSSMNTYAAMFQASSARQLLRAAAAHLTLHDEKAIFPKEELYARARTAHEWKREFVDQQAVNLNRMVKAHELIEKSAGNYAVPSKIIAEAKSVLERE